MRRARGLNDPSIPIAPISAAPMGGHQMAPRWQICDAARRHARNRKPAIEIRESKAAAPRSAAASL
jgi:hypothetical protein